MLFLHDLSVSVDDKKIIDNLSYSFKKNTIYFIMGPNGSGKSTLVHTIMGNPIYRLDKKSKIFIGKLRIDDLTPDKRSAKGIFMSFQHPVSLSGVNLYQYMLYAVGKKYDAFNLRKKNYEYAEELKIPRELLNRSLNQNFSGGEKKKIEAIQMAILKPKIAIFDEIDTGVDLDALKIIMKFLKNHQEKMCYIFITHYSSIFKYIKPDKVLIMKKGKIVKEGTANLIRVVEDKGYGTL